MQAHDNPRPSGEPVTDITNESISGFVEALDDAQSLLRNISDQVLSELGGGITNTQLRLLDRLERLGESRLIDLADALSIAPSTATRLCDALAERQLIVRHRRGRDRRELQIRLTDTGLRLLGAIRERTALGLEQLLERIPSKTRQQVVMVLARLVEDNADNPALVGAGRISA